MGGSPFIVRGFQHHCCCGPSAELHRERFAVVADATARGYGERFLPSAGGANTNNPATLTVNSFTHHVMKLKSQAYSQGEG